MCYKLFTKNSNSLKSGGKTFFRSNFPFRNLCWTIPVLSTGFPQQGFELHGGSKMPCGNWAHICPQAGFSPAQPWLAHEPEFFVASPQKEVCTGFDCWVLLSVQVPDSCSHFYRERSRGKSLSTVKAIPTGAREVHETLHVVASPPCLHQQPGLWRVKVRMGAAWVTRHVYCLPLPHSALPTYCETA